MLLYDAQTSGGLLLSVAPGKSQEFQNQCEELALAVWEVGEAIEGPQAIEVI